MERLGKLELYTFDEVKDKLLGKVGTPDRDEHEHKVADALYAHHIGEAIKNMRLKQKITQEELGKRIGVKRSQVCKLESGRCSITISTLTKVFRALGVDTAALDLGDNGKVVLW